MSAVLAQRPSVSLRGTHRRLFVCMVSGEAAYAAITTAPRDLTTAKTLISVVGQLHATPFHRPDTFEIRESREAQGEFQLIVATAAFEISEHEAETIKATFASHGLVDRRGGAAS